MVEALFESGHVLRADQKEIREIVEQEYEQLFASAGPTEECGLGRNIGTSSSPR